MNIKKPDLYSSLWVSSNDSRGGGSLRRHNDSPLFKTGAGADHRIVPAGPGEMLDHRRFGAHKLHPARPSTAKIASGNCIGKARPYEDEGAE